MKIIIKSSYHIAPAQPHLRQSLEDARIIILFDTRSSGTVISGGGYYSRGTYKKNLDRKAFIMFAGTVTIKQ